ncbi:glycosyltransferase [bacterium (Candidatus Torokbacteria) CG09_land_8_20_14_0_10_42_11]|nr:MAG: glycosyltransferase [bacterium (Candidatus Torokbacteria) CG09_land_8_20_14_0_10_42_11]
MPLNLSIIIPVLNEEKNIPLLYQKLKPVLLSLGKSFEIIFVDDGSFDQTFTILEKIHAEDSAVKVIKFSRNFGKAAAYSAGFAKADGEIIATMDGDLQDDPADLPRMLSALSQGYGMVTGWKHSGKSSHLKFIASRFFNYCINLLIGLKIHDLNCPFKVYRSVVAKQLNIYGDLYRYIPILVSDMGYKVGEIKVANNPRKYGASKYKSGKYFKSFLDFITIYFLIRFSRKPLHFFGVAGLGFGFGGTIIGLYLLARKFIYNIEIMKEHGPLLMFSVLLIVVGFQMVSFGLLAEMLARIYQKEDDGYYKVETVLE